MKRRWNRKKGQFVLEASILVPMICILLVYLVYFTLYTHDCAVMAYWNPESKESTGMEDQTRRSENRCRKI